MVDVAESQEDPWAAASAPADPFVAAAPGSPSMAAPPADPIVSPARPTDPDPWATPSASSDPWIETPTSDPFGAATSPALPARAEGSPPVSVPPASPSADPWSQQPAAPAAEAPEAPGGTPATGARKLRKKLAALTGLHHAGERASKAASKAKEKLAKKKSAEPPPAEPAWSAGDEAPTDDAAAGVAIPAAHDVSPAAARPASLRLRKAAARMTGVHGAFSPRAKPDETDEQRAASRAFDAMDADGDGELSAEEIFEALSSNNSDVTLDRVKELVAKADKNGNGLVSKQEYLDALAADIIPEGWRGTLARFSTAAAEASSAAAAKLGPAVHNVRKAAARATGQHGAFSKKPSSSDDDAPTEREAALQAFDEMDEDGDGELTAEEIHAALLKNDADASLERVKELVAKADTDGNGTVSREEYMEALAADIVPEGWRATLTGAAQRAREAAASAIAAVGPAATKVRKAAAKATGRHGAFSKKNAVPPVDVEDSSSSAPPAPSLESMEQTGRLRAAASRTMMALAAFSRKETIDTTDEPPSPRPHLEHEASGDLRRKQLKKRQGSLAGRLGHEEAKTEQPRKKKGFANLFGKAQHAFHHEVDSVPQPWTAHGAEAVRTALDAFEADERAMCTANLWIERGDAKRCSMVKAALGGDSTAAALGQATPEKASKAIVNAIEGGEPHSAVDAVRALLMMHVPLCKTVHHDARDAFVRAATEPRTAAAQREALQRLVDDLPPIHKQLLGRLAAHLARIVRRQRLNGSSWRGLAAALCPVLLPASGTVSTTAKIQASIACERLLRVVNAGAGGPKSPRAPESPAWSPRQPAPSPAKPHTAFDAFAHMPANPFSPKLAAKKKSPKLAMRPPDHHPPGWAPPSADPWPASPPPMLSRAPDSAAPPPPMPSHTPVKDDHTADPWPVGSSDPWPPHASDAPPPMPLHVPDAPPPMPAHLPEPEKADRPPDWKPPPPPKAAPIEARAVRATYVDEIDSDDSDDDEREWSLRHALEEFGVTKVRVKGKQGVALFASEKDASDALHAHRVGAWRLSSPSIDASGEQILYTGAGSPQVEDDLERLLATT
jgi:Ca2+-binding EF-hand superfamily protein